MATTRARIVASLIAATAPIATSGVVAPAASAAPNSLDDQPHPAIYPGGDSTTLTYITTPSVADATAAAACTPYVDGDYVHVSSGDVSGHGWWYQNNCANTKTTVSIYLYEYFSDGTWHFQGSGSKSAYPGGGSANRAPVRQVCDGVAGASWRTLVKVTIGNGASAYTATRYLACTHW